MISLPSFFSKGMVFNRKAKIWGFGEAGEEVSVNFLGKTVAVKCDESGRFETTVFAEDFGGPHILTVGNITIEDVYVGRVWLCGGQSNMETPLGRVRPLLGEQIKSDSRIRFFLAEKGLEFNTPKKDVNGSWKTAVDGNLDEMYAVPYFFARNLLEGKIDAPLGLLCCPAGGTPIQGWLPEEIVAEYPHLHKELLEVQKEGFVEEATALAEENIGKWFRELNKNDKGIHEKWMDEGLDDSTWESRMLFDNTDLPSHGSVWYRKTVCLDEGFLDDSVNILSLGTAINSIQVHINGKYVHTVDYMYPPCYFEVPKGILAAGTNEIVVRVIGSGNSPAFVPDKDYSLKIGEKVIDLDCLWKRKVGARADRCPDGVWFYARPSGVYNYMLAPLLGYSVEGCIWYQGESNAGSAHTYRELFERFVKLVRSSFGEDLHVLFTQLANYIDIHDPSGENWAKLREAQRSCLEIPNTAMAVAIDCGEWNDLHPFDKKTVGDRLALAARNLVYKQEVAYMGPEIEKTFVENGVLKLCFKHAQGLWAKNGRPILEVIDENDKIHRVYASIKGSSLEAYIEDIKPKAVRYAFIDNPSVTLYNAYGLPASPFWVVTE